MGLCSYAKIAVSISGSQCGNGGAKLQENFAFCEKFEGNLVALRRGERIASWSPRRPTACRGKQPLLGNLARDASWHLPEDRTDLVV
jgi:hypothetical protein